MVSTPFIVSAVLTVLSALVGPAAAVNGIINFGIPLYPDLCCQACHDSLSALSLSCTTMEVMPSMSGMAMGGDSSAPMPVTSDACRASNTPWLQTMAYCLQQKCALDKYPVDETAVCFSTYAVAGATTPTLEESLPSTAPTVELAADATNLTETSLVSSDLYASTYGSYKEFRREEILNSNFAVTVVLFTIGICVVVGLATQISVLLSGRQKGRSSALWGKLKRHLLLPALFGGRRFEPLPGKVGYLPSRTLSIFLTVYVVLNVIFCAVGFGSFQPNTMWMSSGFELSEYVGNRSGVLCLANMAISILLAGRNNLLIGLTGWTHGTFLVLHRWTARVATLQAVVHSICYTVAYWMPGYTGASAYAAEVVQPFFAWGIVATITMCLAAAVAILPMRVLYYETFLTLHIIAVVITLAGCWYHLVPHFGLDYGYQVWLYIAFAFWSGEHLFRLVRLFFYNGFPYSTAVIEAVPGVNNKLLQVTLFPRTISGVGPGQHVFLYLPTVGRQLFWESHPVSVAGWSLTAPATAPATATAVQASKEGKPLPTGPAIRLLVRVHKGATAELQQHLLEAWADSCRTPAYIEGFYSGHRASLVSLRTADTVVCLIGGIGITNALSYVQEYRAAAADRQGKGVMRRTTTFVLAWSARERGLMEHVRSSFLQEAVGLHGFELRMHYTGQDDTGGSFVGGEGSESGKGSGSGSGSTSSAARVASVRTGRMDLGAVLRSRVETGRRTTVLVCGPGGMMDEVTREVVKCSKDGFDVDLIEEAYTW